MNTIAQTTDGDYIVRLTPSEYHFLKRELTTLNETTISLSEDDERIWRERFQADLGQLGLSARLFNTIMRDAPPHRSSSPGVFAAHWHWQDGRLHIVRFYTFEEWCQLVLQPNFAYFLRSLRNFGRGSYIELRQAATAYLNRMMGTPCSSNSDDPRRAIEPISRGVS